MSSILSPLTEVISYLHLHSYFLQIQSIFNIFFNFIEVCFSGCSGFENNFERGTKS
uniref:Uncharacterized protein n=1 Tax=Solanum lycopersicum TaxID=4081 RepID=A0A3Q7GKL7_SOLLC